MMKTAMILGAGGFIGSHLVNRLKREGFWVRGVDLKHPEFDTTNADEFVVADLREAQLVASLVDRHFDEVYQLAADMGGAGYLFTGENDAEVIFNSAQVNLNVAKYCTPRSVDRLMFSSSACVYGAHNQLSPNDPDCAEDSVYPANPESDYGWEKLFSERLFGAFHRNYRLNVRIARLHNVFGPLGTWDGGREKAPAAICRKVAQSTNGSAIQIWGDGKQTRSFLYIDECIEGMVRLMRSQFAEPLNIGSEEMVSIRQLAEAIIQISGKNLSIQSVEGPQGVRGRNSDNRRIKEVLQWEPTARLFDGLVKTYSWIDGQVRKSENRELASALA